MYSPKPHRRIKLRDAETYRLSANAKAWLERYPDPAERRTPAALRELGLRDGKDVSALDMLTVLEAIDRITSTG